MKTSIPQFLRIFAFLFFILMIPFVFFRLAAAEDESSSGSATISTEEFMQNPAAEFFQSEDYERAITALGTLIQKYPGDPLILRYKAMSLDRSGKSAEAIQLFQELLQKDPTHVPTHYFLGQAYERSGEQDKAAQEWQSVVERGKGTPYQVWAEESLKRIGAKPHPEKRAKKLDVAARYGFEYDSNVILKPEDRRLASGGDRNAGRHTLDAVLRYHAYSRRDLALDLIYGASQTLHDDSLDEFNFTSQELGADIRKKTKILDRDVIFGTRYDYLLGFLNGDLFSQRNRLTLSADSRLTRQTRSVFFYRFTPANFGPDGSNPPQTSRDGLSQDIGFTQYFYTSDFRRHFFVRQEYNRSDTRGGNFETRGGTTRLGFHTPLVSETDLDFSTGLEYNKYPRFTTLSSLDTDRRRDLNWDLYVALTHYVTRNIGLRTFYRMTLADNRNGFFEYNRHIGGVQLLFSESY